MVSELSDPSNRPNRPPIRWWPAWVVTGCTGAATAAIRFWPNASFQQKNIWTAQALILGLLLLLGWTLALSRLRWRTRLIACATILALLGSVAASLRIRGVSGDLLPIVEWRFKPKVPPPLAPALGAPVADANLKRLALPEPSTNDYPQFLGAGRTGIVHGPALAHDWQAQPPKLLWRQPIGPAWSGFAVRDSFAVTMEQHGDLEVAACYDLMSGKLLWSHSDSALYQTTIAGEGPRTTPTLDGDCAFTMGATGLLNCLELSTGRSLWVKDVPQDTQGGIGDWGVSCSPLVYSNLVVVTTGAADNRSLAAYDRRTGERVWTGGRDVASYSSPVTLTIACVPQILIFNSSRVTAHDPGNGMVLWEHPWPTGHPHIATPLALDSDRILVSSGYGAGCELLQIKRSAEDHWAAQRLWKSNRLKSKFANLIHRDGHIFGLDDGILVCLDAATGQLVWKEGRYGHGQIISTGDLLLIMAENGDVVLVQASPKASEELTRFKALSGKTWNPPALSGRYLLVRNDLESACYALPLAGETMGSGRR